MLVQQVLAHSCERLGMSVTGDPLPSGQVGEPRLEVSHVIDALLSVRDPRRGWIAPVAAPRSQLVAANVLG